MLNEKKEWANAKEELSQPSIKLVWRMPLSKGAELIKKISSESVRDSKAFITEKQEKLLYQISKLE